jgi:hypothetical protein
MRTMKKQRMYTTPKIEKIVLDNEISLALQSAPPTGPDEGISKVYEYFNNDPYKTNLC